MYYLWNYLKIREKKYRLLNYLNLKGEARRLLCEGPGWACSLEFLMVSVGSVSVACCLLPGVVGSVLSALGLPSSALLLPAHSCPPLPDGLSSGFPREAFQGFIPLSLRYLQPSVGTSAWPRSVDLFFFRGKGAFKMSKNDVIRFVLWCLCDLSHDRGQRTRGHSVLELSAPWWVAHALFHLVHVASLRLLVVGWLLNLF